MASGSPYTWWERHGGTIIFVVVVALLYAAAQLWPSEPDSGGHPAERRANEVCGEMQEPYRSDCAASVFDDYVGYGG